MSPRPHSFAARILASRHARGVSKSALAREVGVSPTCVWNWEEGNTEPRAENLSALARALRVSVQHLRDGTPLEEIPSNSNASNVSVKPIKSATSLAMAIAEAKEAVAAVAGLSPENIRITLDY